MSDTFTDDELTEAAALAEQDAEKLNPAPKKSVKIFINPEKFKEDISINPIDLQSGFINQASLLAYYGMQLARAAEQVDQIKLLRDVKEAELNNEYRAKFIDDGIKYTEGSIANAVLTDKRFIRIKKAYNEAKGVQEMIYACFEAFKHRKDMLVQMGAAERAERQGESYMKSSEAREISSKERETELRERVRRMPGR